MFVKHERYWARGAFPSLATPRGFEPNTAGVFWDLPAEVYHKAPGISQSGLKHFERSPAHYRDAMDNPKEPTPAMRFGTLCHTAILEPELLNNLVIEPDRKRPTKAQINAKKQSDETKELIAFWAEWDKANVGKTIVCEEDRGAMIGARDAVLNHPIASKALDTDIREVSIFAPWELAEGTGSCLRKLRIDAVRGNSLVDVKTCEDASAFENHAYDLRYYRQAAYYLDGWNAMHPEDQKQHFTFIAVEKAPPHGVIVWELDSDALHRGRMEYWELLTKFIECEVTNTWPNYKAEIRKLKLPKWARN